MTLFGRGERYDGIENFGMGFRIGSILRNTGPLGAEPFLIGIGILNDQRARARWMRRYNAKADRPAIVL